MVRAEAAVDDRRRRSENGRSGQPRATLARVGIHGSEPETAATTKTTPHICPSPPYRHRQIFSCGAKPSRPRSARRPGRPASTPPVAGKDDGRPSASAPPLPAPAGGRPAAEHGEHLRRRPVHPLHREHGVRQEHDALRLGVDVPCPRVSDHRDRRRPPSSPPTAGPRRAPGSRRRRLVRPAIDLRGRRLRPGRRAPSTGRSRPDRRSRPGTRCRSSPARRGDPARSTLETLPTAGSYIRAGSSAARAHP